MAGSLRRQALELDLPLSGYRERGGVLEYSIQIFMQIIKQRTQKFLRIVLIGSLELRGS